jgi:hypothetical protein
LTWNFRSKPKLIFKFTRHFKETLLIFATLAMAAAAIMSCRMETVRSLTSDGTAPERLFFQASDSFSAGKIGNENSFGTGFVDLEPPEPTSLSGFGGIARRIVPPQLNTGDQLFTYCKPYTSVDKTPRIKVMSWLENNDQPTNNIFSIISVDVVAIPADVTKKLITRIAADYPQYAVHQGSIQIVGSHTHSGPAGLTENPFWGVFACDRYSKRFWDFFESKVLEAFDDSVRTSKRNVTTWTKSKEILKMNRSRFPGMKVQERLLLWAMNQDTNAQTEADTWAPGHPCLAIWAVHPTWFGMKSLALSSDVVGHVEEQLRAINKNTDCLLLNGAIGNADMISTSDLDGYSQKLADAMLAEDGKWATGDKSLEFGSRLITLPKPKPNLKACQIPPVDLVVSAGILENLPPRTKIAFLRRGKELWVFYPGEPVFTVQESLEKAVRLKFPQITTVQIVGLSNDYVGYLVDSGDFDSETLESCSTLYGQEVAQVFQNEVIEMLSGLGTKQ